MRRLQLSITFFTTLTLCALNNNLFGQNKVAMGDAGGPCFIENKGQIKDQTGKPNRSVKFLLSSHHGMNIELRPNGFSYDTYLADSASKELLSKRGRHTPDSAWHRPVTLHFHRVDIEFAGANPAPNIIAEDALPYRFIYAKGSPSGPQNIEAAGYRKITYRNIYPHIDLVFISNSTDTGRTGPEYEFIIHPGGDPKAIRWKYHGANKTTIRGGAIAISITKGEIRERIPGSYQESPGRPVHPATVHYKPILPDTYGYSVANYDHTKDLVIDPTPDLLWGTYYGGPLTEWAYCVARDSLGNVIFGGAADSYTGIATSGAYQVSLNGNGDAMFGKFDANGNLQWATYYGGSSYDNLWGVAIDRENNIYILGNTFSKDGIATPGAYKTTFTAFAGCTNEYIAKFSPAGQLIWGTYYGGEFDDEPYGLTIDRNDDLVFCGGTSSMTGIATPGAWQTTYADGPAGQQLLQEDVFLAKFTTGGNIVWSTYYGAVG